MMEMINEYLSVLDQWSLLGRTAREYVLALLMFLLIWLVLRIFQRNVCRALKKFSESTKNKFDDGLIGIIDEINPLFYLAVAIYFPLEYLLSYPELEAWIDGFFLIIVVVQAVKVLQRAIVFALRLGMKGANSKASATSMGAMKMLVSIVLWVTAILIILSNLGFNINSLVASLGIGGVAVALAVQNILSDIFSSFSIYFDKPFEVGDYIQIGEHGGTVRKIGLKTTRLTTLNGEELVVSNQELTSARVQNYKKMQRRRPEFTFGVTYETPTKKLRIIPELVKEAVESMEGCTLDRCSFVEFGDSALNYRVIYYIDSPDVREFEEDQSEINIRILQLFAKNKIEMAYPTTRVLLEKA